MIIVCPTCLAKNRVPEEKLSANPSCGQCHAALLPAAPIELNEQNFSQFISHSDLPVFIDLWAEWCGPCKMMAPHFAEVAKQNPQVIFAKINTEESPRLSSAFNVRSIPTLVLMNKTTEIARIATIATMVRSTVASPVITKIGVNVSEIHVKPEGMLSLQTIAMPADTNWSGDVFGGWIVSQMDLAGAIHAERFSKGRCATISINQMTFLVPVKVGDVISCYTKLLKVGNTSIQMEIEVWDSHDSSRPPVRVTEGVFTFVAVDVKGNKRQIPVDVKEKFLASQSN